MMRRMISSAATRGRLTAVLGVGLIGIIIGIFINRAETEDAGAAALFLENFGLRIFVPLVGVVVSTAVLGNMLEERNLVYFWLRPLARWKIAVAAWMAAIVVLLPLVLVPLGVLAAIVGDMTDVRAMLIASAVGAIAYSGLFTMLGSVTQKALIIGLGYILVWEGIIAGFSRTAGSLAITTYTRSALMRITDVALLDRPAQWMTIVLVAAGIAVASIALTTGRLTTMDVD